LVFELQALAPHLPGASAKGLLMSYPSYYGHDHPGLIQKAQEGHRSALGRLFEEYRPFLHNVVNKLMGPALNRTLEPADVIQETLLIAATRFTDFHGGDERELRSWLVTLARHKLVDLARHNGRLKRAIKANVSLDEPRARNGESMRDLLPSDLCTASQFVAKKEMSDRLIKALTLINPREAAVLRMRYVEELTLEEIGHKIGTGRNGVRGIISRGLRNLRRILPSF
jgi:RNA polymerase sigma-70 factor (ECF subfamily)